MVDSTVKAREYFEQHPLDLRGVRLARKALRNPVMRMLIERSSGKLSRQQRDELDRWLAAEEKRLKG
jgi:hypothetical protein